MKIIRDVTYWAKRALLGLYGPADLDKEHDPVQQLKREHAQEVKADEESAEPAGDPPRTP